MGTFEQMEKFGFGRVFLKRDPTTHLQAIIAVHDTRLGPALGGCRFLSYGDEEDALRDALRLARGMTYKAALAGLPLGGGKSVILRPKSQAFDREALFRSFGRFVNELRGLYITAVDSGSTMTDMETIRLETAHVTGLSPERGGAGDPSPFTATGVRRGIEAAVAFALGKDSLSQVRVAVQGAGQVGHRLCRELIERGAHVTVADADPARAIRVRDELGAVVADEREIASTPCDVFAPCALGGAINDQTIGELRCKIVAGAANNQLLEARHGDELANRGIFYAPDYAINAGGLIHVAREATGFGESEAERRVLAIYETIYEIARRSEQDHIPSHRIADALAEERLEHRRQP